jgi:hypothetical protein
MSFIVAFVIIAGAMAIGDIVAVKTKAFVPSVFVAAALFLIGFWTFWPQDILSIAGIPIALVLMSIYLLLVHMGTMFSIKELASEWKTIVIALSGLVGMVALLLTIGMLLVGREVIIVATPPLTGGIVAAIMMSEAATAKGLTDLSILAIVMYVMQGFAGYPLTALALKKEGIRLINIYRNDKEGLEKLNSKKLEGKSNEKSSLHFIPPLGEKYQTTYVLLVKTAIVGWASVAFAGLLNNVISAYVIALLFGVLAAEIGFLERHPMTKSKAFGYLILALMAYVFDGLKKATPEMLSQIAWPLIICIVIGVIGMAIVCMIVGRMLGYSKEMSFALSLTALYGFPPNYVLTEEAAKGIAETPEEQEFLMDQMLPKMLIGGFTTVTIFSVILAGIFVKML